MRQKLDNDDLHRLRGEVDRLNRLQAAMNSVQAENDQLNGKIESLNKRIAEQQLSAEELEARELKESPTVQFASFVDAAGNAVSGKSHQATFVFENPSTSLVVCAFHQPDGPVDRITGAPQDALITIQPNSKQQTANSKQQTANNM